MGIYFSKSDHGDSTELGDILLQSNSDIKCFSLTDLQKATNNFRADRQLPGGVYKGWINMKSFKASHPRRVAVVVKAVSQETLLDQAEWLDEVNILGNLSHPNIVGLIGYCTEGEHRFLVSEYMSLGNLENHSSMTGPNKRPLSWSLRFKIVLGVAKGLAFLHSAQVGMAYEDFNPSKVLLDFDHNPKLHGFRRRLYGDYGDRFTRKFDLYTDLVFAAAGRRARDLPYSNIYSYGVVLLEVVLGIRFTIQKHAHHWAQLCQPPCKCRQLVHLTDKGLKGKYPLDYKARAMAKLALRCQSNDLRSRPSMAEVVVELEALQNSASSSTS